MKSKILYALAVLLPLLCIQSCTNPTLDDLRRRLDDHESRLAKVEKTTAVANQEIQTLKSLLSAQAGKKMVDSYRPLDDGTGYLLTFTDGTTIKLLHGKDGSSSAVGVKEDPEDHIYYWTLNGSWMLDPNGRKIQAQGLDGVAGVTPLLRVSPKGYWEYSLDGKSWHLITTADGAPVKATGDTSESGLDIKETDTHIIIYFKGQTFMIPKDGGTTGGGTVTPPETKITLSEQTKSLVVGEQFTLTATLAPTTLPVEDIVWSSSSESIATVTGGIVTAISAGEAEITASIGGVSASCMVTVTAPQKVLTFELKAHDLHAVTGLFDIIPSETDMSYYASVTDKKNWESNGGAEGIFEYDKRWFSSSGAEWTTVLGSQISTGVKKDLPSKEVGATTLTPDTEYVFYAYGLTEKGEKTSDVSFITFTTTKQIKKGLTFEINVEDVLTNGIIATVQPSSNDLQYVVALVRDNYGKFYSKREDLKKMGAWKLIHDETILTKGKYIISPESKDSSKYERMLPGFQYWIVVFGYDEDGITSEVVYYPFKTKKRG